MAALTERRSLRKCTIRRQWGALALAGFGLVLMVAAWHSTAKAGSVPVGTYLPQVQNVAALDLPAKDNQAQAPLTTTATLFPFLDMVPSPDGTELYISARGVGQLGGTVFANIDIGPGHNKGGWTMTYSDTVQGYIATATGFTPGFDDYAPINITTTLGLDTGSVEFNRDYVPASTPRPIASRDGNLELEIVSADTITYNTYILAVPSYAPPGPPPGDYHILGNTYSVRAAGALVEVDRPMLLRLYYSGPTLAGIDARTLAILMWDSSGAAGHWDKLEGTLHSTDLYVEVTTTRFTTYALMGTPWRVYLPLVVKK